MSDKPNSSQESNRPPDAGCSVIYLLFNIEGVEKVAMKPVNMPILPPGSNIWCFPVDEGQEAWNEISFYTFDERGRVCCHFKNSGFQPDEMQWLVDRGYVIE